MWFRLITCTVTRERVVKARLRVGGTTRLTRATSRTRRTRRSTVEGLSRCAPPCGEDWCSRAKGRGIVSGRPRGVCGLGCRTCRIRSVMRFVRVLGRVRSHLPPTSGASPSSGYSGVAAAAAPTDRTLERRLVSFVPTRRACRARVASSVDSFPVVGVSPCACVRVRAGVHYGLRFTHPR